VWQATHVHDIHIPEFWAKGWFSDLYAGTVRDVELEHDPGVLTPPPPPKKRRSGMARFGACTITMGPDPTDPVHSPAHTVEVPAFMMDRYEVTVAEFCAFLNEGGHDEHYHPRMMIPELCGIVRDAPGSYRVVPGREDYPVVYVNHDAALAYAQSRGKTLPTEAMWERAARGTAGRTYPWGDDPIEPGLANYDFHYGGTLPVGSFPRGATPEGVHDLCGNVKEWTGSEFTPYPGGAPYEHWFNRPFFSPPFPEMRWRWVNRGGAFSKQETCMAAAYRDSQGHANCGFRCVKLIGD
jgi:iron(II)-dependent oxidoreductase